MDKSGNPSHLITTRFSAHTHRQMALSSVKPLSSIFSNSRSISNPPLFTSAKTQQSLKKNNIDLSVSRRDFMNVGLFVMPLVLSPPPPPSIAREVAVGSYLPPSPTDPSFVLFKATPKDTPALRAVAQDTEEFGEPSNYTEAISSPNPANWLIFMNKEIESLHKNSTWSLVKPPSGKKIVGCKWVFKKKEGIPGVEDARFKARLVAKGYSQLVAGNVQPYTFILPPTWKQTRVANILSGNYCQPKCAEPWVEVKFEDEKQGKVQVVASPLIRLTNKPNATIEDIGTPEKLIASLGPFVTGNTLDPDELLETSIEKRGDLTYYKYVLETPYALTGSHNLAKATAKGNTVVLFVVSASDKQWSSSKKTLEAILDSFEV